MSKLMHQPLHFLKLFFPPGGGVCIGEPPVMPPDCALLAVTGLAFGVLLPFGVFEGNPIAAPFGYGLAGGV